MNHQPIVHHWYTDLAGRLFQVKAYVMGCAGLERVMIAYSGGEQRILNAHEWYCLLTRRPPLRSDVPRREKR